MRELLPVLLVLFGLLLLAAAAFLAVSSARRRLGAAPVFAFAFAGIGGVLGALVTGDVVTVQA